ncbi:unnamed protein product [Arabidopsis lyrata]|nr:unnamed protein product [Arabidopsis lyrata]
MGLKAIETVVVIHQVIGIITHISWTAAKFPMKCDVLSITGTNEQVVDIKTRSSAMKWPTAFYESFGPKFDIKKFRVGSLLKNMKEHKNPKVLSEGLLWMVSAVDDCVQYRRKELFLSI